jgi:hypothetical protein
MNKWVMKNLRQEEEECIKLKIRECGEKSGQGSVYAFLKASVLFPEPQE